MNRRACLSLMFLGGCAGTPLVRHPVTGFNWYRQREVKEVTIHVYEGTQEEIGSFCTDKAGRALDACAFALEKGHQIAVPMNDPMATAHEALHALGWNHD